MIVPDRYQMVLELRQRPSECLLLLTVVVLLYFLCKHLDSLQLKSEKGVRTNKFTGSDYKHVFRQAKAK